MYDTMKHFKRTNLIERRIIKCGDVRASTSYIRQAIHILINFFTLFDIIISFVVLKQLERYY